MNNIGIYKITSPSGKLYIGQSINIKRRFNYYKGLHCKKQIKLYNSLLKHGFENHKCEVCYSLPNDTSIDVLTCYEEFFINQHLEAGFELLNIQIKPGKPVRHNIDARERIGLAHRGKTISKEVREAHSKRMKGRVSAFKGWKHTDETKAIIKEKRALQKNVKCKYGGTPWNKGMSGVYKVSVPKIISEETRKKISKALTGKKLSPETIAKRTATLKKNGVKRRWTEEAKKKQSERYLGKKLSPETIEKIRKTKAANKLNRHAI